MVLNRKQSRNWILCAFLCFATTRRPKAGTAEAFLWNTNGASSLFGVNRCMLRMNMQVNQPCYITIGPPCAGKTTLLAKVQERTGTPMHDVTLDAQPNVYVTVPTDYFLVNECNQSDVFLRRRIQYKPLGSRIYDDETIGEFRAILQRFDGRLTSQEFNNTIQNIYTQHANTTSDKNNTDYFDEMTTHVIDTVEEVCRELRENATNISLPPHLQLFCVESLFRPHPQTNKTGIEAAVEELSLYANHNTTSSAVAWGNTNTRPREYLEALKVAAATQRPVYFIVYAQDDLEVTSSGVHLPNIGIEELYKRNVLRMLKTGKFVPGRALVESNHRIRTFLTTAVWNLQRHYPQYESFSKLELDQELAKMVNFEMKPDRTVERMVIKKGKKIRRPRKARKEQQAAKRKDSKM